MALAGDEASLTVCFLSLNGHSYLRRQLLYLSEFRVKVLISDASPQRWELGDSGCLGDCTWSYVHEPGPSRENFWNRLRSIVQLAETEFLVLADDEDWCSVDAVLRAVAFLQRNPDHAFTNGIESWTYPELNFNYIRRFGRHSESHRICQDDGLERLAAFLDLALGHHVFYAVHRVKVLRGAQEVAVPYIKEVAELGDWFTQEYLHQAMVSAFLLLTGKFATVPFPFHVRVGSTRRSSLPEGARASRLSFELFMEIARAIVCAVDRHHQQQIDSLPDADLEALARHIQRYTVEYGKERFNRRDLAPWGPREEVLGSRKLGWVVIAVSRNLVSFFSFMLQPFSRSTSVKLRFDANYPIPVQSWPAIGSAVSPSAISDAVRLRQLWSRYPKGLSSVDLQDATRELGP